MHNSKVRPEIRMFPTFQIFHHAFCRKLCKLPIYTSWSTSSYCQNVILFYLIDRISFLLNQSPRSNRFVRMCFSMDLPHLSSFLYFHKAPWLDWACWPHRHIGSVSYTRLLLTSEEQTHREASGACVAVIDMLRAAGHVTTRSCSITNAIVRVAVWLTFPS